MGAIDQPGGEFGHGLEPGAFATRLANLLRHERERAGQRVGTLARRSGGRFSAADLRRFEAGTGDLERAPEVAELYGADLEAILPERLPLEVHPDGTIATAGVSEPYGPDDETSLLVAYLRLVRRLRNEQRAEVIALRRADVETLAGVLALPGETVTDRLGALMGATRVQRRVMVGMFVAGAAVIGLTVGTVAATSDPIDGGADASAGQVVDATSPAASTTPAPTTATTTTAAATTTTTVPPTTTTVVPGRFLTDRGVAPSLVLSSPVLSPAPDDVTTTTAAPATTAAPPPPAPPAPTTTEPEVVVAPPPVPTTTVPVPDPVPTTEPEIVVGPPPIPTTVAPIPEPVTPEPSGD